MTLAVLGAFIASPAHACMVMYDAPSREDLRALMVLDKDIAAENTLKIQIDVSVWGVFLDDPSQSLHQNGYSRFKVGGALKGKTDDILKVVTNRRDISINTQIQYLNLRKIDRERLTDVGVPQHTLNWGKEVCETSPDAARCEIYQLEQNQIKARCEAFISEIYSGCFSTSKLPKICLKYKGWFPK